MKHWIHGSCLIPWWYPLLSALQPSLLLHRHLCACLLFIPPPEYCVSSLCSLPDAEDRGHGLYNSIVPVLWSLLTWLFPEPRFILDVWPQAVELQTGNVLICPDWVLRLAVLPLVPLCTLPHSQSGLCPCLLRHTCDPITSCALAPGELVCRSPSC